MIFNLSGGGGAGDSGVTAYITNGTNIVPTGTYATSEYYDTDFGVKIGYTPDGDVVVAMKGGTSETYRNIVFGLTSNDLGVSVKNIGTVAWGTGNPTGQIFSCLLTGVTQDMTMAITMSGYNAEYEYVSARIAVA